MSIRLEYMEKQHEGYGRCMIMNGQMKNYERYLKSLEGMEEPIIPNVIFDMHGAVEYANKKGVKISELSDDEKKLFVKEKIAALRA